MQRSHFGSQKLSGTRFNGRSRSLARDRLPISQMTPLSITAEPPGRGSCSHFTEKKLSSESRERETEAGAGWELGLEFISRARACRKP